MTGTYSISLDNIDSEIDYDLKISSMSLVDGSISIEIDNRFGSFMIEEPTKEEVGKSEVVEFLRLVLNRLNSCLILKELNKNYYMSNNPDLLFLNFIVVNVFIKDDEDLAIKVIKSALKIFN